MDISIFRSTGGERFELREISAVELTRFTRYLNMRFGELGGLRILLEESTVDTGLQMTFDL